MNSSLTKVARTRRALFLLENLNLPKAANMPDAKWEKFQIDELNSDDMFGIEQKCRQVGWSFLIAMRAVADAILTGRDSVFNSINKDESQEKFGTRFRLITRSKLAVFRKLPSRIVPSSSSTTAQD